MNVEDLKMLENLCKFMIRWAEREPDSILPDPLGLLEDDKQKDEKK